MLIGATLAVIVLLVFLRHGRITAISAASIPLTLAITVFIMSMIGQTFNLMTLGAMAIAIGLVIDDAVVITENIARHLRLTTDRLQAIRAAVQELIWPVTTSTLTTVVVFLPLGLLQGVVGQFFAALATTLTVAVLVSLLLALTLIPLLAEQFVTAHDVAAAAPRWRPLARLEQALDALAPRYRRARDVFAVIDDVRDRIQGAVPRLHIEFMQILADVINDLAGAARPVEIKLYGEPLDTLEAYARRLAPELERVTGLEDLYDGVSEPAAELLMRVHQAEADRIGLTPVDVGNTVAGALLGTSAGEIRVEDRPVAVRVRAPDAVRFDPLRLRALPIVAARGGRATPLGSLAAFEPTESRLALDRENQQQMIALTADVSGRSLGGVMGDVHRVLAAHPAPRGVRVTLGGQYAGQQEAFRALLLVLALAAVSVCAVMVVQFESFTEPLVVLLVAPVSFVGALVLLLATGTVLNASSLMALILLLGGLVKRARILLDFTRLRMQA